MSNENRNIHTPRLETLDWSATGRAQSLEVVIDYVCSRAEDAIGWYLSKKDAKRVYAQWLRMAAIVLAVVGGALPALSEALGGQAASLSTSWAYVAGAVAAGLIALDRFGGFSSAWMRFLGTQMTIQDALSEFLWKVQMQRVEWQGQPPTDAQVRETLTLCDEFAVRVRGLLRDEMEAWRQEFQAALKDVETAAKAQREAVRTQMRTTRPGALTVTVSNGDAAGGPWSIAVDGQPRGDYTGRRAAVIGVPPGLRTVSVTGTLGGKPAQDSVAVEVTGGATGEVELTLA